MKLEKQLTENLPWTKGWLRGYIIYCCWEEKSIEGHWSEFSSFIFGFKITWLSYSHVIKCRKKYPWRLRLPCYITLLYCLTAIQNPANLQTWSFSSVLFVVNPAWLPWIPVKIIYHLLFPSYIQGTLVMLTSLHKLPVQCKMRLYSFPYCK